MNRKESFRSNELQIERCFLDTLKDFQDKHRPHHPHIDEIRFNLALVLPVLARIFVQKRTNETPKDLLIGTSMRGMVKKKEIEAGICPPHSLKQLN